MVERIAGFVGTLAGMIQLIATGAVIWVLFGIVDVAQLETIAVLAGLGNTVAACPEIVS